MRTKTHVVWEGTTPKLMARVVADDDGLVIVQADVSSIAKVVWDVTTVGSEVVVVASEAVTVSTVVFDTLQTDARWTEDSTGYNFAHVLAITDIPDASKDYLVQYQFTGATSGISIVEFKLRTRENYHS